MAAPKVNGDSLRGTMSLADMVKSLKAPVLLVSAPEVNTGADPPEPVMILAETLSLFLNDPQCWRVAVDFAGSSSANWCNTRKCDASGNTGKDDWNKDLTSLPEYSYAQDDAKEKQKIAIENSYWMTFWRGKVSGALMSSLHSHADDAKLDGHRVVIAVSVDGGPITQTEKAHIPSICKDVLRDVRSRGYYWSKDAHIAWCHFSKFEDVLASMLGFRNIPGYGIDGSFCEFACQPRHNTTRGPSLLNSSMFDDFANENPEILIKHILFQSCGCNMQEVYDENRDAWDRMLEPDEMMKCWAFYHLQQAIEREDEEQVKFLCNSQRRHFDLSWSHPLTDESLEEALPENALTELAIETLSSD
eukprot:TRINITY_DN15976_c0_g1_i3.p1 TRINITY_DN15976_c0_g1~~TRINITY_DN15976_c0_g1_i3.p1  ORF type:complete len:360 (-),score=38.46 TRINITY_DN15976_c0_g1_i3:110-1189(-)